LCSELQLDDYVWFTGYVPRSDLVRYLSTADICLDPNPSSPLNDHSTWIKVLEYMAFGKPIVSFDLKETRYSAGDAAVYAPPNDDHAYAKAIMALMDNPEQRARMGRFGWSRVRERLAWEHVSKNLVEAYDRLFDFARPGAASVGTRD
jgi:glycosyltransferase involved in cell wall biosynthesis